ncbi:protein spaetzle-like [Macrosteles quadrilineatus]|uniref:protein spaetzle-like n=1 Tax=Macrosteles quadrilineatus TaxID=74068 RepID=UPI0023E24A49|nr:protein spaetzle-like [Macrosteles quadrilineatus]
MGYRRALVCLLIFLLCSIFGSVSSAAVETSRSESTVTRSKGNRGHDPIVFPTDLETGSKLHNRGAEDTLGVIPEPSPCPDGALFCESADDYPEDLIKKKLKKQPKLLLDLLYTEDLGEEEVHNKFGPENEKELCNSYAESIFPNKGNSTDGTVEIIVNDNVHKQGLRIERCTKSGNECNELPSQLLPLGYKSSCKQKYITRQLVVLNRNANANSNSDVEGFVTKAFQIPSCCSCVITMSFPGSSSN